MHTRTHARARAHTHTHTEDTQMEQRNKTVQNRQNETNNPTNQQRRQQIPAGKPPANSKRETNQTDRIVSPLSFTFPPKCAHTFWVWPKFNTRFKAIKSENNIHSSTTVHVTLANHHNYSGPTTKHGYWQ